ncbi:MAG: hypothetical protein HY565_01305 [Candidatus Kerfeldbacteria bacterium]|nr:hypothetical protein [Candidatus Kerfeldbacteria bacterium]
MNVYLVNNAPTDLATMLKVAKVNVWSRLTPGSNVSGFTWNALERVDAIIIELAYPSDELHYVLAQSIVLQRPTLCLYPKNRQPHDMLAHLNKPGVPKTVSTRSYSSTNVREVLDKFLQGIDHTVSLAETPNIKFTLRLTPAIERYLNWLAQYRKANKADYIRKLIKDDADKNAEYQRLL